MTDLKVSCLDFEKVGLEHLTLLSRLFLTDTGFLLLCKHRNLNTKQFEELRSYFRDEKFYLYKIKKVYTNMFFLEKQEVYDFVNWSTILTGSILVLQSKNLSFETINKMFELTLFYEKQNWMIPYLFYREQRFYSLVYIKKVLTTSKTLKLAFYSFIFFKLIYITLIIILLFFRFYFLKKIFNKCLL